MDTFLEMLICICMAATGGRVEYYACDLSPHVVCAIQAPRAFRAVERKRGAKATFAKFDVGRVGGTFQIAHTSRRPRSTCS